MSLSTSSAIIYSCTALCCVLLYLASACRAARYQIAPSAAGYCIKLDVRSGEIWSIVHDSGEIIESQGFVAHNEH